MVSTFSIPTNQTPSPPRKVPLHIHLGDRPTDPADLACVETVLSYLSTQVSRVVSLSELEGLSLYLWSEDEVDGRGLIEYSENGLPLQGLLLNTLGLSGDCIRVESDELMPFVGKRFEFLAGVLDMDKPTLLREKV